MGAQPLGVVVKKSLILALVFAGSVFAAEPVLDGMDTSVVAGNDFYDYANGGWLKSTEIPADRSFYGTGAILTELNLQRIHELIEHARQDTATAAQPRAIGVFYETYVDEAGIEKRGTAPLEPTLKRIEAIQDKKALARLLGESVLANLDVLNNVSVETINLFDFWIA